MTPFVTMRRALSDQHLLGAVLGGDSWLAWRVLLIAAMGEPLTDEERPIFAKLTGRGREPGERVDELWCVVGRRGGKSRAIAALLVYLATMVDYCSQLVLGERGVVLCLARTQEQSQVVLEYVAGIIEAAPILAKMVIRRAADSLTLFNRGATIVIAVRAASFRSVRGLTCVAAVADEIAFWQAEDASANPDVEILRAVRPTLLTTHGPLIAISSPYARKGELWTTFKRDYGPQGDPRILVAHAASRDMTQRCGRPTSIGKWTGTRHPAGPNTTPSFGPTFRPLSARKSSTVALRMASSSCRRPPASRISDSSIRRAARATQ
jgi:hypothetical protein